MEYSRLWDVCDKPGLRHLFRAGAGLRLFLTYESTQLRKWQGEGAILIRSELMKL
jgi:hypothetical protein